MSTYVKIQAHKITNIIVCSDEESINLEGYYVKATEERGVPFMEGTYDELNDKFIKVKPFESWVLNSEFEWESPKGANPDMLTKIWDEQTQDWADRV
jgi:hypothetical protein